METKYFIVSSIDGDYAWLTEIGSSAEPVFFARARCSRWILTRGAN